MNPALIPPTSVMSNQNSATSPSALNTNPALTPPSHVMSSLNPSTSASALNKNLVFTPPTRMMSSPNPAAAPSTLSSASRGAALRQRAAVRCVYLRSSTSSRERWAPRRCCTSTATLKEITAIWSRAFSTRDTETVTLIASLKRTVRCVCAVV